MTTKADLEADLAKAERKIAKLEKAADEVKEAPAEPKIAIKKKVSLDSVEADLESLKDGAETDAVLIHLGSAISAVDRARSARRAYAHETLPRSDADAAV